MWPRPRCSLLAASPFLEPGCQRTFLGGLSRSGILQGDIQGPDAAGRALALRLPLDLLRVLSPSLLMGAVDGGCDDCDLFSVKNNRQEEC